MTSVWFILFGFIISGLAVRLWWLWRSETALREALEKTTREHETQAAALQAADQRQAAILRAIPQAFFILNQQSEILYLNPTAETLVGSHAVGKPLTAILRHPDLARLLEDSPQPNQEVSDDYLEINHRQLQVVITPVQNHEPQLRLVQINDQTELHRLNRARREMVANISHELRTPITNISLIADTLLADGVTDKKRSRKMLKDIARQAAELTQIVQEMRDLAKIESGQMPVRMATYDLATLIHKSLETLTVLAEDKQQILTIQVPAEVMVLADVDQIQRVVKNLVHNAIKFTPPEGRIDILAQLAAEEVIIEVKDTGAGIAAENLTRIFERFFQEDFARTDGTGLGLAIARHIILSHGERIWVQSEQGKGSSFFFSLSLSQAPTDFS